MFHLFRYFFIAVIAVVTTAATVPAQTNSITLAWSPNARSENVTEYKLYYKTGASGRPYRGTGLDQGDSPITIRVADLADRNNPGFGLSGLTGGATYRLVLTASNGVESRYSSELSHSVTETPADLDHVEINGPSAVPEGSTAQFRLQAIDSNGNSRLVTAGSWRVNCADANISPSGVLTTEAVNTSSPCTITARYSSNGLSRSDNIDIEISDNDDTATLERIVIRGPGNVNENASATYTCRAFFSDGSDREVAARSWRVDCPEADMSNDGVLTTDEVQADSECTLTARFSSGGITESAQKNINIRDNTVTAALRRIEVQGPNRVNENSTTRYTCRAFYSDGSQRNVKPDWSIKTGATFGRIDARGNLKTNKVDANAKIVILASYSDAESIRSDTIRVTVNNKSASTPSPKQIIIDNGAAGTSHKGGWRRYSNKRYREKKNPPHERDSVYSRRNGDTYTLRTNIDGIYMISLRGIKKWGQSNKVPVKIYNGKTLIDIVHVDQKKNRDRWVSLGTYRFNKGFARVVVISSKPATSIDGIRFLKKTKVVQRRNIIVDNGDFGTSYTGKWKTARKKGTIGGSSVYSLGNGVYTLTFPINGRYKVSLRWDKKWGRSDNVPVKIYDGNKLIKTLNLNQEKNSGRWNQLGTYKFSGSARVKIISRKPATSVDGVKFSR